MFFVNLLPKRQKVLVVLSREPSAEDLRQLQLAGFQIKREMGAKILGEILKKDLQHLERLDLVVEVVTPRGT